MRQISGTCAKTPPTVSVHQMLWFHLTPNPSTLSAMKTPGNTKENPDDLEIVEGDIHTQYCSD
jgi:hypothetical protein